MREKICTVKHSCGSKRRPKVMTCIGRTHPTSSTRHTTTFSLKKEVRVLNTPILSTRVPSDNNVHATASSSPSFLSSNSKLSRRPVGGVGICQWSVCSTTAPPHSENVTTRIKMPYTHSIPKYKPFRYFKWNTTYGCM